MKEFAALLLSAVAVASGETHSSTLDSSFARSLAYLPPASRDISAPAARTTATAPLACTKPMTVMIPMRDGVRLNTDIYLPPGHFLGRKFSVILSRGPYGNPTHSSCPGTPYELEGVVAVFQDTRGQHGSEGNFSIFLSDGTDGYDTMDWIAKQPWYGGHGIVTYGGSALGITQLMVAPLAHPEHRGMFVVVGSPDIYGQIVFPGGVLRRQDILGWVSVTAPTADANIVRDLHAHPTLDDYWTSGETLPLASSVQASGFFLTGWFDFMSPGSVAAYLAIQAHGGVSARGRQQLMAGIIGHGTGIPVKDKTGNVTGCQAGQLVYPAAACAIPSGLDVIKWAKNRSVGGPDIGYPVVRAYTLGDPTDSSAPGNVWQNFSEWPPAGSRPVLLYSSATGTLAPIAPYTTDLTSSSYVSDPLSPVPTVGGRNLLPGSNGYTNGVGPFDQVRDNPLPPCLKLLRL